MQLSLHYAEVHEILNYHELQWLHALDASRHVHLAQLVRHPRGGFNAVQLVLAMEEILSSLDTGPVEKVQRRSALRLLLMFAAAIRDGHAVAWQGR